MANVVVVRGLPVTCNPTKIKLQFEDECKVRIDRIKVAPDSAEIKFFSSNDCRKFKKDFSRSVQFGNDVYSLEIVEENGSTVISPSSSRHDPPLCPTIQKDLTFAQTWSSLEELPKCSIGIVVQSSQVISCEDIWAYFGNNQESWGGEIATMFPMIDGMFIAFKDESVGWKIWNARPHRLNGKAVTVYLKHVPHKFKNKLVVKLHHGETSREDLCKLFEKCSEKNSKPSIRKYLSGVYLVVYKDDIEEQALQEIAENFQRMNPRFNVSFLTRTDCIEVGPVPPNLSHDEIKALFENKERTNGGTITRIDYCESSLLVYFGFYKDAEAVVAKFSECHLQVFDVDMRIQLYQHCLSENHTHLKKRNPIDEFLSSLFPNKDKKQVQSNSSAESGFLLKNIQPYFNFLMENPEHFRRLKDKLQNIGQAEIAENGIRLIPHALNSKSQSTAATQVEKFLGNYTKMGCRICDEKNRRNLDEIISGQSKRPCDLSLRWSSNSQEVVVVGLKSEVETFIKSMQPFSKSSSMSLEPHEIRWLKETGIFKQLKKDYLSIDHVTQKEITFSGKEDEIYQAKQAVSTLIKKLARDKFTTDKKEITEFLIEAEKVPAIYERVTDLMKEDQIPTILVIKNKIPYLVGLPECVHHARALLSSALAVDESMEMHERKVKKEMWEEIGLLESEGKIRISFKEGALLSIAGFRTFISKAKEKISAYGFIFHKSVRIEYGALTFVKVHNKFEELCKSKAVSYQPTENDVLLRGKRKELETVADTLEKLRDSITKKSIVLEKFGLSKFLKSKQCKDLGKDVSMKYRSTVTLTPKPPQKLNVQGNDPSPHAPSTVSEKCFVDIGKLKISVREGDITEDDNDAIIVSVGPSFDLSEGMLPKKIVEKGGKSIKNELKSKSENDIRCTSSGRLRCKKLFHVSFPVSSEDITKCFVKLLALADAKDCKSISIPAVRTGSGQLAIDALARLMMRSVRRFVADGKEIKHLRRVDIVLLEKTQVEDFKKEMFTSAEKVITTQPLARLKTEVVTRRNGNGEQHCLKIGNLMIAVRQGDITEEKNHAIVNSTGPDFKLDKGMVSKAIIRKGGPEIQQEVNSVRGKWIRITGAGKLECRKIIHAVAPEETSAIGDRLSDILGKAEENSFPSLSIPAIGTGVLKKPVGEVAKVMMMAINQFLQNTAKLEHLKRIDFVIYQRDQTEEFRSAVFGERDASTMETDCVEISTFSLERDEAEKALKHIQDKIDDALSSVITNDAADKFSQEDDKALHDLGKKFHVKMSRSEGQISICGMSEDRQKAGTEVESLLEVVVRRPNMIKRVIWEYSGESDKWVNFDSASTAQLEESYQKFSIDKARSDVHVRVDKKERRVNLKTMTMGKNTKIQRKELPGASKRQSQQMSFDENHYGNANKADERLSSSGSSRRASSDKKRD